MNNTPEKIFVSTVLFVNQYPREATNTLLESLYKRSAMVDLWIMGNHISCRSSYVNKKLTTE
ncbi:MAG: hypothetical protein AB1782_10780 [Cyanobacteriota bacterium]